MSDEVLRGTLHECFARQAARTPEAIALTCAGATLTYGELDRRANRLAHRLQRRGVGRDVLVGLYAERSLELIVGLLAILKTGGAYVPIDPAYPRERIAFLLSDARAQIIVTQSQLAPSLPASAAEVVAIDCDDVAMPETAPALDCGPNDLAYVIYTSGSTGTPKGVLIPHRNVVRLYAATEPWFGFTGRDVWTLYHSHAFDFSVWEIWGALLYGGSLVIVPFDVSRTPTAFYRLLVRDRVSVLNQTPTAFRLLQAAEEELGVDPALALRYVIFGGEALDFASLASWYARHDEASPRLVNMYGITETTVHVTYRPLARADTSRTSLIGEPIPDLQVHLLDERGAPVADGDVGEICVGGAGLARGYLGRPALTAEKFIADPFATKAGARLYRSGDLARRLPDGELEYLGRRDDQVKIRGYRIELGEIEAILAAHPAVRAAVAVAREIEPGDTRIVAHVVARSSAPIDIDDLRAHARRLLPEYMVPAHFVVLESLPLTSHGKIDRKALRHSVGAEPAGRGDGPRTELETALAAIWREVLRLSPIGRDDRFDALGGSSLGAMKVAARVRRAFDVEVPLCECLGPVTVAGLAAAVKRAQDESRRQAFPPLAHAARDREIPASYPQQSVRFLQALHPDSAAYQFVGLLWIAGALDVPALERSLAGTVRRHEVYRTTFPLHDGVAVQVIHDPFVPEIERVDFTTLPESKRDRAVLARANDEAGRVFDPERLPLVHWTLARLAHDRHALIQSESHLIHDGWSWNVLLAELKTQYDAFSRGEEPLLPELPCQFADFALWQREWASSEAARREIDYWRQRLAGSDRQIALPTDRPHPRVMTFGGRVFKLNLGAELTRALAECGRCGGASLFMTSLAVFAALLHNYSGEADMNIGSGVANRRLAEFEGVLGMFVNTVVLRLDLDGDPTFGELLHRVRATCLEAYDNQDVPFESVVAALRPPRSLGRQPLFQVMFSFHDSPLGGWEWRGTRMQVEIGITRGAKADLNVIFVPPRDEHGETAMMWEYNTGLFDTATVARLAREYVELATAAAGDPDRRLSMLAPRRIV